MARLKNWSFKDHARFLEDYGFRLGHVEGSHFHYNGRINGSQRVVQVIHGQKERESQSDKTMKMSVRHSGIPTDYYQQWKTRGVVHEEIIG